MIDYGLLLSALVALAAPAGLARRWPLRTFDPRRGFIDAVLVPALVGLAAGRLAALLLDDRRALGRVADMLIIRSGVEFWPALGAAMVTAGLSAKRSGVAPLARLADLAAPAMVGYGAYEAACLFRDGCYGPHSAIGLRPRGLATSMLPVGLLMAVAVVTGAVVVHWLSRRSVRRSVVLGSAIAIVATVRAVGSFWLPKVGQALTRQHRTSLVVAVVAITLLVADAGLNARHPDRVAT